VPLPSEGLRTTLHVNGVVRTVEIHPTETLLNVLRDDLKLFGAREGCGVGMCGACTVLVDGKPVSSCLTLAAGADDKEIVTVEGLESDDGRLDAVQQAFLDAAAFQCAYCTPGFVLSAKALLRENPDPTLDDVREYLAGNLCRCGSYANIEKAVLDAAVRLRTNDR
jgi:aerobic-type carbon monoxide dehydrogenase small subunit (CoxS/CutS family)